MATLKVVIWLIHQLLSASVHLASAAHSRDFKLGSLQLCLCNGMAKQVFTDQITFCAAVLAHCYSLTLFILRVQRENVILDGSTEHSMRRTAPFFERPRYMTRTNLECAALTYAIRSNITVEAHIIINIPNKQSLSWTKTFVFLEC
jgi:hypothetical protein